MTATLVDGSVEDPRMSANTTITTIRCGSTIMVTAVRGEIRHHILARGLAVMTTVDNRVAPALVGLFAGCVGGGNHELASTDAWSGDNHCGYAGKY